MDSIYQMTKTERLKYAEFEVSDFPEEFKGIINERVYPKACHERAIRFLIKNFKRPGYKLIHAAFMDMRVPEGPESFNLETILHSVVEIRPGVIYDGVFNRLYQEEPYFKARNLRKHCVWNAEDGVFGSAKTGYFVKIEAKPLQIFSLNTGEEITDYKKYLNDEIKRYESLPMDPMYYECYLSDLKSKIALWEE